MHRIITLAGSYGFGILLSMSVNFLTIPIVIQATGAAAWAGLAVGQAVGSIAGVVIGLGWPLLGPAKVAAYSDWERASYFRQSVLPRLTLLFIFAPLTYVALTFSSPANSETEANFVAALTALTLALGASWFLIGEARPLRLLSIDTIPRAGGTLAGAITLLLGGSLWAFVLLQLLGAATACALTSFDVLRRYPKPAQAAPKTADGLRSQLGPVGMSLTATLYVSAPLVILSLIAPAAAPVYAMADRLQRFALRALQPVSQAAQGYVPAGGDVPETIRRLRLALKYVAPLALMCGAALALALPAAGSLLSGGEVFVPWQLAAPLGVATSCVIVTGVIGLSGLAPLGRFPAVFRSTMLGAVVGLSAAATLGMTNGAVGVGLAVALAEVTVLLYQLLALRAAIRTSGKDD
ncbi:lipopolysaccharide biosynthesis protein [Herbiconiux sp. SYSU D00978]|uniref:lipopolysaccharide biosynthesis protein n=1 Tax=Herbiconiux sp. SYSU D00978 TaxID=2812562 RepID=UPI001A967E6F|nr:hypothetical protein [Herbiconiux sp. SYSU D00978]